MGANLASQMQKISINFGCGVDTLHCVSEKVPPSSKEWFDVVELYQVHGLAPHDLLVVFPAVDDLRSLSVQLRKMDSHICYSADPLSVRPNLATNSHTDRGRSISLFE